VRQSARRYEPPAEPESTTSGGGSCKMRLHGHPDCWQPLSESEHGSGQGGKDQKRASVASARHEIDR
jgi:hypothetical protein